MIGGGDGEVRSISRLLTAEDILISFVLHNTMHISLLKSFVLHISLKVPFKKRSNESINEETFKEILPPPPRPPNLWYFSELVY